MRKLFIIAVLFLVMPWLYAQVPDNAQTRNMNLLAIELMDRYELNSTLWNKQAKSRFSQMFENKRTEVFCDLCHNMEKYGSQIPIEEYVGFITDTQCEILNVRLSNIERKGSISFQDGQWYYTLTFDKEIIYHDKNYILFPVGLGEDGKDATEVYKLEMTLVIDPEFETARIHSLVAQQADDVRTAEKHIIVQMTEAKNLKFEKDLTSANQHLRYNSYDQAVVPSYNFKHPDEDVWVGWKLLADEDAYELIQLTYKTAKMRLKFRNEIAPVMYSMTSNPNKLKGNSFGYSVGFDLGSTFQLAKNTKGGIYVGASLVTSTFTAKTKSVSDYTLVYSGSDGNEVEKNYSITKVKQTVGFTDLAFPVYLNVESKLNQDLALTFDIGAKVYLALDEKTGNAIARGRVDGNEFVSTYVDNINVVRNPLDFSLFFTAGADYTLIPRKLYLEGKIGYERGLGSSYSLYGNKSLHHSDYPVVYDPVAGADVLIAPVINGISIGKSALWLNLGLKYKF